MIKHTVELHLLKKSFTPSVNITQADTGHQIECTFPDFILPSGTAAKVWAIKPSGKIVYNDCIVSENTVLVNVTNQMAAEKGVTLVQIKLTNNGELVSSFPVHLKCSMDVSGNGTESENEITALDKFLEEQAKKLDAVIAEKTADITQNKTDIAELKKDVEILKEDTSTLKTHKADAIVETASGETIQVEDSSGLGFEGLRIFGRSTQDGTPTPESPVPIASVGDKGTVEIGVTGKNLVPFPYRDKSKVINNVTVTIQDDGRLILNGTASGSVSIDLFLGKILLKDGATYVASKNLNIKINNDVIVSTKYIAKKGDYISHIWYWYATGTIFNNELLSPQVEISSKITSYEPYRTPQSLTLATPNGLLGIKVDSDGNYTDSNGQQWICDEIDLERGKYVQRVWNAVLNSSLGQLSVGVHGNGVHYLGVLLKVRPKINSLGMCERYKGNERWTDKNGYVYIPSNRSIIITDNRFTDIDSAKRIIDTEQAKLLYIMDTPIEHDLTPEEITAYKTLHTNYPTTVVSNDESAHMEVSYVADTKNYIASKIETPLQKQITDLQNALISQKISGGYKSN